LRDKVNTMKISNSPHTHTQKHLANTISHTENNASIISISLKLAKSQHLRDDQRVKEWKKILLNRTKVPAYVQEPKPSGKKISKGDKEKLISKLSTPLHLPRKKVSERSEAKPALMKTRIRATKLTIFSIFLLPPP